MKVDGSADELKVEVQTIALTDPKAWFAPTSNRFKTPFAEVSPQCGRFLSRVNRPGSQLSGDIVTLVGLMSNKSASDAELRQAHKTRHEITIGQLIGATELQWSGQKGLIDTYGHTTLVFMTDDDGKQWTIFLNWDSTRKGFIMGCTDVPNSSWGPVSILTRPIWFTKQRTN